MKRRLFGKGSDTSAAVAPLVALSLFVLVGSGGLALDYARLASLDTELQNAADQAALAAATQMDRASGSRQRARDSVRSTTKARLAQNVTLMANDGDTDATAVTIQTVSFCSAFDDSVANTTTACTAVADSDTGGDAKARFVIVTTEVRAAKYALTPIVGAFASNVSSTAVAGVQSSICNVAPLLVCVASDDFPTDADTGKGIILKTAGGNSWAPGNYGFLDFGNGNPAVLAALLNNGLNGCQSTDDNETEPGNKNATDAINTRMDVYLGANKNDAASCVPSTGAACPAQNTRKDMTLMMTYAIEQPSADAAPLPASVPACGTDETPKAGNPNPSLAYSADFAQSKDARQFGRDTCHYSANNCTGGNFGDGIWDRDAYLAANHPGFTAAAVATAVGGGATATTLTRYQVYLWETANMGSGKLDPMEVGTMPPADVKTKGSKTTYTFTKQCAFNKPVSPRVPAANTAKDRRTLPIVAANCTNLKGKGAAFEDYVILRVFDIFLTEPSLQRSAGNVAVSGAAVGTDDKEIYGEVIGPAQPVGGGGGFQYYSRSRPYLVR